MAPSCINFDEELCKHILISYYCLSRCQDILTILQPNFTCTCKTPEFNPGTCHRYYYCSGFNKVTLQSTHWSIQTLFISGGDSSCSWVFYSCTGPKSGKGVVLVDCNAVGGWPRATSINQCVE